MTNKSYTWLLRTIVILEAFALSAQLILHFQTVALPIGESLARFFSYFTILTNLLTGLFAGALLLNSETRIYRFFNKSSVQAAITMYIAIVGLIYNLVLRQLWNSSGLQAVLHDILHTAVPLLVLFYWYRYAQKTSLNYVNVAIWLLYPAVYTIIVIVRGTTVNWYPYPFFDLEKSTPAQVATNCVMLLLLFLVFGLVLVFAGRRLASRKTI